MSYEQVIKALEKAGTAQNRKVYARHGVKEPMFGVSFAELGKLTKQIRTDHELAMQLWKSGNHDARVLATMIADPARLDRKTLDAWADDLDCYVLADAVAKVVSRSPRRRRFSSSILPRFRSHPIHAPSTGFQSRRRCRRRNRGPPSGRGP